MATRSLFSNGILPARFTESMYGGGTPPFSPLDYSPVLWLDGADTSPTNIQNVSKSVSQWSDKSGNANHISQPSGGNQPKTEMSTMNGRNVITMSAAGFQSLYKSSGLNFGVGNYTMFVVFSVPAITPSSWLIYNGNYCGVSQGEAGGSNPTADCSFSNTSSGVKSYGNTSFTGPRILGAVKNGTSQFVFDHLSDKTPATANAVTTGPFNIGSFNGAAAFTTGDFGEILCWKRVLSTAERNDIGNYLKGKWGAAWTDR